MSKTITRKVVLTLTEALIPQEMFNKLPEYSGTLPTGVTIGKCWKRNVTYSSPEYTEEGPWLLGCYERRLPPEEPGGPGLKGRPRTLIRWREITTY